MNKIYLRLYVGIVYVIEKDWKMNKIAYIYLESYEDENNQTHYTSKAEGSSFDLTMLIAYLYHDQKDMVEAAMQEKLQETISDGQEIYLN